MSNSNTTTFLPGIDLQIVWSKILNRRMGQFSRLSMEHLMALIQRHCYHNDTAGGAAGAATESSLLLSSSSGVKMCQELEKVIQQCKSNELLFKSSSTCNSIRKKVDVLLKKFLHEVYRVVIDESRSRGDRLKSLEMIEGLFGGLDTVVNELRMVTKAKQTSGSKSSGDNKPNQNQEDSSSKISLHVQEESASVTLNEMESSWSQLQKQVPQKLNPQAQQQKQPHTDTQKKESSVPPRIKPVAVVHEVKKKIKINPPEFKNESIFFAEDFFSMIPPRSPCKLWYTTTDAVISRAKKQEFDQRLKIWEPYWNCLVDLTPCYENGRNGFTFRPCKTQRVQKCEHLKEGDKPLAVAQIPFRVLPSVMTNLNLKVNLKETPKHKYQYNDGQRRIILRMLPCLPAKMVGDHAQADCHLWPKGTFLQINGKTVPQQLITQRKQQIHDPTLWKGMSRFLDITPFVKDPSFDNTLSLLTYDENDFIIQIAIMEYRSPSLLQTILRGSDNEEMKLNQKSFDESLTIAKNYLNNQTIVLDGHESDDKLTSTFHLFCPIAMTPINIPVRGRDCKHFQCFDLSFFLHTNLHPSGRRWRCLCCDNFISVYDLVHCSMFQNMIVKNSENDKLIEFHSDGTWKYKVETVKKRKMKDSISSANPSNSKQRKHTTVEEEIVLSD